MVTTRDALQAISTRDGRTGLKFTRHFTTPGIHPYDELEWETRDAVITDFKSGAVAFEQRDVEFPKSWSMNATTIVAQKYFRGQLGTPQRERSVRHMVDRVADTITGWGRKDGYFADEESAEIFNLELKHLLVTQKAAFNSPVWFNCGVEEHPQCSACFILSVEDTMRSILNWYVEEGTIFKGGSGSGVNLSRIRSSKEQLKGGGEASGPVSFMRGADASAGTIKCLHRDTPVVTDRGVVPIADVVPGDEVLTRFGFRAVEQVHDNGTRPLVRVRTALGDEILCTPEHRFRVRGQGGEVWREAQDLRPDDHVVVDLGATGHGTPQRLEPVGGGYRNERVHELPEVLDEAFALWLGWLYGDGSVTTRGPANFIAVQIGDRDPELVGRFQAISRTLFGPAVHFFESRHADKADGSVSLRFCSTQVIRFLERNGLRKGTAGELRIPALVQSSPAPVRAAFLSGLFEADGHIGNGYPTLSALSAEFARDVHRMLLSIGIPSTCATITDRGEAYGTSPVHTVRVVGGEGVRRFAKLIGFLSERKSRALEAAVERKDASPSEFAWALPHVAAELDGIWRRGDARLKRALAPYCRYAASRALSLPRARALLERFGDELAGTSLTRFAQGLDFYTTVTVEPAGEGHTFDLTVRDVHEYLVHNVVTHNSGGKTRRAAKMVILNVDHPDIEEFIWCKQREEQKARALREAGFDMDLDGKDSASIQYQNANNSVRVTDEFMRAVENDEPFSLRAVTTGDPVGEPVRARDLFRQIAQAAWECADPGVQYDGTINDWHTTPNAGRINGSNPCSEYMHLDNSACNLASLNLRKFEYDGVFDVDAFRRGVEVIFTAQEIIVGNSSYPTERIGANARAYRQLGIGYANLGGLLMSQGLAYDSDEGRAWAAAITALMTGHAYRTSAEIAKVQGPFDGFAQDREGVLRVIAKHGEACGAIDAELAPANILEAAKQSWADALMLGTEYGIRNAQASVLAPTGCLVGGSLVATERGLVRLASLGDPAGPQWQDLGIQVATDEGQRQATKFYVNGLESVVTVDTARGYRIQGTPRHQIKVVQPDGSWVWKRFGEIQPDDVVPLALDQLIGEPQAVALPPLPEGYWTGERHAVAPRQMTPDLAEFIGYFMGDGSLHSRGIRLCVAQADLDVAERLSILGKGLFGLEAHVEQKAGYLQIAFDSVRLVQWWEACGFAKREPRPGHRGKGWEPHIPDAVLYSNDRAVYAAFLRGLFEADGTVTVGYPSWSTTSLAFTHDVQSLLLALGYPTTRKMDVTGWGQSDLAVLRLLNSASHERWLDEVGFMGARKNAAVAVKHSTQSARHDKIPLPAALIERVAPSNDRLRRNALQERHRSGMVSRRIAQELFDRSGDAELGRLLGFFYDRVASAELGEDELTYDLSVPDNVTYLANGFVSHNTIGLMMDCDTTGIEPDLGLVKAKKLVGGGNMRIVNQTVPAALEKLGYQPEQVEAIVAYIDEHGTIEGAPAFRDEHLPVFDCAMGARSIGPMGHVKMMAAVQPFISGAISKCVTAETLVSTADGLVRIGSLYRGEQADSFRDEVIEVASLGGTAKTDAFYYGGVRKVRKVTLRSGHTVTGTENHRVLVAADGALEWRYLDEIQPGEYVATRYGTDLWSALPARFDGFSPSAPHGSQKAVRIPAEMTEELAFLLGAYAAEGHRTRSNWTVTITNSVEAVLERVAAAWRSQFGVEAVIDRQPGKCPAVKVSSKTVVEFLDHLGAGARTSQKRVPDAVLRSPKPMVLAFLQGLHLDAYASVTSMPKLALCVDSPGLLDDYQAILTNLGIVHGRISKLNNENGKTYDEVYAVGEHAARLAALVPFMELDKAARAAALPTAASAHATADVVPGVSGRELYELIPAGRPGSDGKGTGKSAQWRFLLDPRTTHVTRRTVERVAAVPGVELPEWLRTVLDDNLHFSPVTAVEDAGQREVFDLSVPLVHAFVGNGIVNHNTVNLPESATVEEVEQLHMDAWKLGVKAIAIYRDNCKVAQPLALAGKKNEGKTAGTTEAEASQHGVVRRRLPKSRPSQTISFMVGDADGYLTAGEYPGDGLGEIFVKLGKQGSTLSGVMDAFAISVSLGLQYGVPLEAYVKKFINMRFEPAGMTDDPEVKFASSIVDYMFRRLAIDYLPVDKRQDLGIHTLQERNAMLDAQYGSGPSGGGQPAGETPVVDPEGQTMLPIERPKPVDDVHGDAPMCFQCGVTMNRAGSCHVCPQCGTTSGCS